MTVRVKEQWLSCSRVDQLCVWKTYFPVDYHKHNVSKLQLLSFSSPFLQFTFLSSVHLPASALLIYPHFPLFKGWGFQSREWENESKTQKSVTIFPLNCFTHIHSSFLSSPPIFLTSTTRVPSLGEGSNIMDIFLHRHSSSHTIL